MLFKSFPVAVFPSQNLDYSRSFKSRGSEIASRCAEENFHVEFSKTKKISLNIKRKAGQINAWSDCVLGPTFVASRWIPIKHGQIRKLIHVLGRDSSMKGEEKRVETGFSLNYGGFIKLRGHKSGIEMNFLRIRLFQDSRKGGRARETKLSF